jgi:hypothetical protein
MRRTAWILSVVLLSACASGTDLSPGFEPVIGQSQTPDAGTAAAAPPAQPDDARCDSSLDAAQGVTVTDTGACPGLMPATPTCARDFKLCTGTVEGSSGPGGTRTSFAVSDGSGDLLLACGWVDTPLTGVALYSAGSAGFVQGAQIGPSSAAVPLQSGFTLVPLGLHDKFALVDGSGAVLATAADLPNLTLAGADGAEALWADGQTLFAQRLGADGAARSQRQPLLTFLSSDEWILGGGMDVNGHALLLVGTAGGETARAIWLAPDGHPETGIFSLPRTAFANDAAAALPGGGLALGEAYPVKWHAVLAAGATQQSPAPAWLAARGTFQIVRGAKALLFGVTGAAETSPSSSEMVTPGGTSCGTLSLAGQVGLDGTFVASSADQTTFRVYPGLLR